MVELGTREAREGDDRVETKEDERGTEAGVSLGDGDTWGI